MTEWKGRRRVAKNEDHIIGQPQGYSRGYIPHFDQEGLTQTLTFCLFDSMPQAVLEMRELKTGNGVVRTYGWERRHPGLLWMRQSYLSRNQGFARIGS